MSTSAQRLQRMRNATDRARAERDARREVVGVADALPVWTFPDTVMRCVTCGQYWDCPGGEVPSVVHDGKHELIVTFGGKHKMIVAFGDEPIFTSGD